jgi:hypothetical protein
MFLASHDFSRHIRKQFQIGCEFVLLFDQKPLKRRSCSRIRLGPEPVSEVIYVLLRYETIHWSSPPAAFYTGQKGGESKSAASRGRLIPNPL